MSSGVGPLIAFMAIMGVVGVVAVIVIALLAEWAARRDFPEVFKEDDDAQG